MDQKMKDTFCRQIDTELERISKLPSLDNTSLNQLHMLTDTKKNILKIEKLESEMSGMMDGSSYRGSSYDRMGGSYGYPMQQYPGSYYDGGYSRMDGRSHLEAAMRDARNDQEREEIRQLMSRYHN